MASNEQIAARADLIHKHRTVVMVFADLLHADIRSSDSITARETDEAIGAVDTSTVRNFKSQVNYIGRMIEQSADLAALVAKDDAIGIMTERRRLTDLYGKQIGTALVTAWVQVGKKEVERAAELLIAVERREQKVERELKADVIRQAQMF